MKKTVVYTKMRGVRTLKPGRFETYREKYPDAIRVYPPGMGELEEMVNYAIAEAVDGCGGIEPDGYCGHGYPSWLIAMGYI